MWGFVAAGAVGLIVGVLLGYELGAWATETRRAWRRAHGHRRALWPSYRAAMGATVGGIATIAITAVLIVAAVIALIYTGRQP
jgi:uncharacterized BrkB/YihY/UPF0761 family membrane protein